ncbi:hypothetical protein Salat_1233800 [Sesamum alatum]|uniref:Uncharacterized protein n=1 Tax=Sesamum alatum TaxID=300844 RepID=A0AAE2CPE4_9LAMI|nr:hypothetical protein Salat_1233800 [Sesamum alatum]
MSVCGLVFRIGLGHCKEFAPVDWVCGVWWARSLWVIGLLGFSQTGLRPNKVGVLGVVMARIRWETGEVLLCSLYASKSGGRDMAGPFLALFARFGLFLWLGFWLEESTFPYLGLWGFDEGFWEVWFGNFSVVLNAAPLDVLVMLLGCLFIDQDHRQSRDFAHTWKLVISISARASSGSHGSRTTSLPRNDQGLVLRMPLRFSSFSRRKATVFWSMEFIGVSGGISHVLDNVDLIAFVFKGFSLKTLAMIGKCVDGFCSSRGGSSSSDNTILLRFILNTANGVCWIHNCLGRRLIKVETGE